MVNAPWTGGGPQCPPRLSCAGFELPRDAIRMLRRGALFPGRVDLALRQTQDAAPALN
jgi:hypothetical protein